MFCLHLCVLPRLRARDARKKNKEGGRGKNAVVIFSYCQSSQCGTKGLTLPKPQLLRRCTAALNSSNLSYKSSEDRYRENRATRTVGRAPGWAPVLPLTRQAVSPLWDSVSPSVNEDVNYTYLPGLWWGSLIVIHERENACNAFAPHSCMASCHTCSLYSGAPSREPFLSTPLKVTAFLPAGPSYDFLALFSTTPPTPTPESISIVG